MLQLQHIFKVEFCLSFLLVCSDSVYVILCRSIPWTVGGVILFKTPNYVVTQRWNTPGNWPGPLVILDIFAQVISNPMQPRLQSSWGQHGAHLGPVGPRLAPCWPHEPCYQGGHHIGNVYESTVRCLDICIASCFWLLHQGRVMALCWWTNLRDELTYWSRDKMATVSQTTLSNAFSWMKMLEFQSRFHWSLFLGVQLTIFQHWFR